MSKLYIVATPIGNLEDITYRAVRTLKEVDFVICEYTIHSVKLLYHTGISKTFESMFVGSEKKKAAKIAEKIAAGSSAAFITDAGTPGIQDPGTHLVRECVSQGIEVIPVPGPSALVTALSAAGLTGSGFVFEGFLPVKQGARKRLMQSWVLQNRECAVAYESTHRILKTLQDISEVLGSETQIVIARELTKKFEEFIRGSVAEAITHLEQHSTKGEFVLMVNVLTHSNKIS
ncbi:MAG: 16S rRNA (cytidine(1402)-2'-O)-methyltransferase [Candidatus Omnitrophica bacterium]|nr:16S rRNA (cytidine(1402)-2'-O)-methyltransferase [Candidatus Omnitrophota bacterium]